MRTVEQRLKTSEKLKGHTVSEETRTRISSTLKSRGIKPVVRFDATGVKRSENYKIKMRLVQALIHKPTHIQCGICEKHFRISPARLSTAKYCSKDCQRKGLMKPKSLESVEKIRTNRQIRDSFDYKIWRRRVFERDDYTCQSCCVRGVYLHADHELSFALYPDLRFEVLNGRTLCVPCHKRTSTYGGRTAKRMGVDAGTFTLNKLL